MSNAKRLSLTAYLSLALRNLLRNPRRTGITLATMIFGIATLTLLSALNDGWLEQMRDNFILSFTGHVQIHASGFESSQNLNDHIKAPGKIILLLQDSPEIQGWTQRIRTSGLVSLGGSSAGVQIMATDPEQETWVTHMHRGLKQGRWLNPGTSHDLLLGITVAQNIGAEIGDRIVLMAQRPNGEMVSEIFFLRGILETGAPQIDRTLALIPLNAAQAWFEMGESVTDIVIRASSHENTAGLQHHFNQELRGDGYEILAWQDLDPMVRQWLEFSDAYGLIIILVVVALVLTEILNTMLISLHERQKELGIMIAIGTRKSQIFFMLLIEAVMLILLGGALGYGVGGLLVLHLSDGGIDLSYFANAFKFFYMDPVILPLLTLDSATRILGTTLVAALIAGLYPAWRATKIEISQSLRTF
ncbi:MAG: ABC transporter permease [Gammaproteobacteria bacterium (ex Lamellibrachia satsuma)]|nr:MAG: ABC transporter permease [Gammaproteobacteria bacterium (ex Lamellibrachia satsuma)]RRS30914.1 MAG: ABC transporter permease [Gammaproteobacteria bacterium (ex Lamellibrachia satsuma)]RRS37152.1 MAG: ABC transporter permease [Gammaproteobacteria bacterium (ex Lamellibrachia satsuma)]